MFLDDDRKGWQREGREQETKKQGSEATLKIEVAEKETTSERREEEPFFQDLEKSIL